jgi:transposase
MMGERVGRQDRHFYEFDLEDMVPGDHLLRRIDVALDLSWLRGEMKAHYSRLGCPSICPELMVRMLIVGQCYSIHSERRLCQEVKVNLAYCWFCGLGLEDNRSRNGRWANSHSWPWSDSGTGPRTDNGLQGLDN